MKKVTDQRIRRRSAVSESRTCRSEGSALRRDRRGDRSTPAPLSLSPFASRDCRPDQTGADRFPDTQKDAAPTAELVTGTERDQFNPRLVTAGGAIPSVLAMGQEPYPVELWTKVFFLQSVFVRRFSNLFVRTSRAKFTRRWRIKRACILSCFLPCPPSIGSSQRTAADRERQAAAGSVSARHSDHYPVSVDHGARFPLMMGPQPGLPARRAILAPTVVPG